MIAHRLYHALQRIGRLHIHRERLHRGQERLHDDVFSWARPAAGAIVYAKYDLPVRSTELVERIRTDRSVLLVPGSMFGVGKGLRFGFGYDVGHTLAGLARVDETLAEFAAPAEPAVVPLEEVTAADVVPLEEAVEPIGAGTPDAGIDDVAASLEEAPVPDVGEGA